MTTTEIEVNQTCCEWKATLRIIRVFCSQPIFVIKEIVPRDQMDDLSSATEAIGKTGQRLVMCHTSTSVLFTEAEVTVLALVVDWFEDMLLDNAVKLQKQNSVTFSLDIQQTGLIKRNLKRNAKATNFTFESPCGGDDTPNAGAGRGPLQ